MRGSAISESAEETEEESLPAQPSDEISLQEEMELLRSRIPEEPTEGRKWIEGRRAGDIIRVRIVYPDGTKLQRNFLRSDDVGLLLDLVTLDIFDHQLTYKLSELCMTVPKVSVDEVGNGRMSDFVELEGKHLFRSECEG